MNSLFIGLISTSVVLFLSLEGDISFYAQRHSMIIVLGGSLTILLFTTPNKILKNLWVSIKDLFKHQEGLSDHKEELLELSNTRRVKNSSTNPLINYASDMWEQGIDSDLFIVLLSQKKDDLIAEQHDGIHSLKNLAKYPPALGMTGTVMGMIALFSQLDSQQNDIGQNLAIAMTATFFGLIVANGLVSPLSDRLAVSQAYYQRYHTNVYQILLLINSGEPVSLVTDEVEKRAA